MVRLKPFFLLLFSVWAITAFIDRLIWVDSGISSVQRQYVDDLPAKCQSLPPTRHVEFKLEGKRIYYRCPLLGTTPLRPFYVEHSSSQIPEVISAVTAPQN